MPTPGQNSLNNFYRSLQFVNSRLAALVADDVTIVAIESLGADKSRGQVAADRLRQNTRDLPEVHRRVLESALTELGYS